MIWSFLFSTSILLVFSFKLLPMIVPLVQGGFSPSVFRNEAFTLSIKIGLSWAFFTSVLLMLFSTSLAWGFRKRKKLLYSVLFVPWAIPVYMAAMVMRFVVYGMNGNSIISLLGLPSDLLTDPVAAFLWTSLLSVWLDLPLVTVSILSAIENVPKEEIEAAKMDGARESEVFLNVVLPEISRILEGWFLLHLVRYSHAFTIPFLLADGGVTKPEWITPLGAVGNVTTLGMMNYRVFQSYDDSLILSFSIATYAFLFVLIGMWMFRKGIGFSSFFSIFSLVWSFSNSSLESLALIPISFFPPIPRLLISIFFLVLFPKNLPAWILLITTLFSIRMGIIRSPSWPFKALSWLILTFSIFMGSVMISGIFLTAFTDFPDTLKISKIGFDSILRVIEDGYLSNILNSLLIAIPVALLSPILSFPVAHWISRKNALWMIQTFLVLRAVSGIHALTVIFLIYSKLNLINTLPAVSILIISNSIPQMIPFMKGHFDSTPRELEEAAMIEGGKSAVKRMVLRMSLHQISVGMLMGFMAGWNAFLAPLLLLFDDSLYPASVKLYGYVGNLMDLYPRWDLFGAGVILNLAVAVIVFSVIRKYASRTS